MIRTYITFQETVDLFKVNKGPFGYSTGSDIISKFNGTITNINQSISTFDQYSTIPNTSYVNVRNNIVIVNKLIQEYVYPQYYNKAVGYYDTDDDKNDEIINAIGSIMPWLEATTERYSTLIANLNDAKEHLMDRIKTISRYNDTPQGEYDYSDENHTTTITVSEAEGTTLMARLNEIENNLKELYRQWSFEFGQVFVIWSA